MPSAAWQWLCACVTLTVFVGLSLVRWVRQIYWEQAKPVLRSGHSIGVSPTATPRAFAATASIPHTNTVARLCWKATLKGASQGCFLLKLWALCSAQSATTCHSCSQSSPSPPCCRFKHSYCINSLMEMGFDPASAQAASLATGAAVEAAAEVLAVGALEDLSEPPREVDISR